MTDDRPKFELEDDDAAPPRRPVRPPAGDGEPPPPAVHVPAARDEPEIDTRTVAERTGKAVPRVSGVRPKPPGWPLEALAYPLRRGGVLAAAAGAAWVFDLVGWWNLLVGWIWKAVLLLFLLRWQTHAAGMSAAGHDAPPPFDRALEMDRDALPRYLRFLGLAVVLALPGAAALLLGNPWLGAGFLVVGSAWLASAALGDALSDPSLRRPTGVAEWVGRRPLALLVGSFGWWAFGLVEWLGVRLQGASFAASAVALLAARAAATWLWLVSARALGVAGRAWMPPE